MKSVKFSVSLILSLLLIAALFAISSNAQFSRLDVFRHHGVLSAEKGEGRTRPTEAPTGFDNLTNGFDIQGPDFDSLDEDNVTRLASFNDNRFVFEEIEGTDEGLGPTYNAQSCAECHQNVATGGASQVAEHRTGHLKGDVFVESLGGSLVHSRATSPEIVERVNYTDDIRTLRISTNTLGSGFI